MARYPGGQVDTSRGKWPGGLILFSMLLYHVLLFIPRDDQHFSFYVLFNWLEIASTPFLGC